MYVPLPANIAPVIAAHLRNCRRDTISITGRVPHYWIGTAEANFGKTAFVTGAASGIGFALSRIFAETGMKVMLADIETDALTAAVENLQSFGPNVRGVRCDVADPASVEGAAEASYGAFGNVHVVCNNAGVGGGSGIDNISLDGEFFDSDFFVYREDADVAWRAQLMGWSGIYAPLARGYHVRNVLPGNRRALLN